MSSSHLSVSASFRAVYRTALTPDPATIDEWAEGTQAPANRSAEPCYTSLTLVNISGSELCGIDGWGPGSVYNADSSKAIADAIAVTPSPTSVDLSDNIRGYLDQDTTLHPNPERRAESNCRGNPCYGGRLQKAS